MAAKHCGAKNQSGAACKARAMENGLCRMHGGSYDAAGAKSLPDDAGSAPARPPAPVEQPNRRNTIQIRLRKGEALESAVARVALDPIAQSAMSCKSSTPGFWNADVNALNAEIGQQVADVNSGDMSRPEAMLLAQAHTLDAIFNKMLRRASGDKVAIASAEKLLGLAFKAQSQCRTTLQTLVDVKYPRQATFIRQANIANQQQVNNGVPVGAPAPAREVSGGTPNQLLTGADHAALDSRGTEAAIGADSHLAAVEVLHRTEDAGR